MRVSALIISFFLMEGVASAVPSVSSVSLGTSVAVSGTGFGTKSPATPLYWDGFETYTAGAAPTAGGWIVRAGTPTVSTTRAYSGTKAVEFITTSTAFQQMSRDMGSMETIYYRGKTYLDNSLNPCGRYQWKGLRFSSSPGAYAINEEPTTSIFLMDSWWYSTTGWGNTGSPYSYYNGGTNGGSLSAPSTLFPFEQWFDYEFIGKRATAPSTANGSATITINGTQKSSKTDYTTHDADDGGYRYMLMGGTVASCTTGDGTTPITPNNRIYYDDVYMDNTVARVELCDSPTWGSRTHCEIQPPAAWSDTAITTTYNQGSFAVGATAYLYIVDSTGAVSAASGPITISVPGARNVNGIGSTGGIGHFTSMGIVPSGHYSYTNIVMH